MCIELLCGCFPIVSATLRTLLSLCVCVCARACVLKTCQHSEKIRFKVVNV
jgi:hypothetical protein